MQGDEDAVGAVVDALRRYVADNPQAADLPEGIRDWWLAPPLSACTVATVERALMQLVAEGALQRRQLPDGRVLYLGATPATSRKDGG